ncbi:putative WRKY transcription factor 19 [Morella rubra]|uniref:Putative WRKY transcription factor 19 n=1 Tax=Morella rubra TaxID=262757 RepID=A0A6A1VFM8_9ROSI|nr:putative WRKY transcription factor 19 [Morella rubra]
MGSHTLWPNIPVLNTNLPFRAQWIKSFFFCKGTNKIEAIVVDLPDVEDIIQLSPEAFMEMKILRLFINRNARFSGELNSLPNMLRVLDWPEYHLPSLHSNFHGKKLIDLRMPRSLVQYPWIGHTNLTFLNFSYCELLTKVPSLSRHPNLKELILSNCINLEEIHDSVGLLDNLVRLYLNGCSKLRSFPRTIKLRSLEDLDLEYCSSLLNFPEIEGEMKNLYKINLVESGMKELPSSIRNISGLRKLRLDRCKNLTHLPGSIIQLQHLEFLCISECPRFIGFKEKLMEDNIQFMASIVPNREYEISGSPPTNSSISNDDCYKEAVVVRASEFLCPENLVFSESNCFKNSTWQHNLSLLILSKTCIVSLPASIKRFVRLRGLYLDDCEQLQEILELPQNIEEVDAKGCISLESFPQVSKKFQFDTSADSLDKLDRLDLQGCHKLLKRLWNPVLSPSLRTDFLGTVYAPQEIPISSFSLLEVEVTLQKKLMNFVQQDYVLEGIADSKRGLPTWFGHRSSCNRCWINMNLQECLEEAITISLCAVILFRRRGHGPQRMWLRSAYASIVREGRFPRRVEGTTTLIWKESMWDSPHLFLAYTTVEPSDLVENHLDVEFSASAQGGEVEIASCEVHRGHEHKQRAKARKRKNSSGRVLHGAGGTDVQMGVSNSEPENLLDLLSMIQLYRSSSESEFQRRKQPVTYVLDYQLE